MHIFHMGRKAQFVRWVALIGLWFSLSAGAQSLRYDTYRELAIPPEASFRLGPFYSEMRYIQGVGYRYVTTSGDGADQIFADNEGEIKKDGSDFPLSATIYSRNYVLLNPDTDLDITFQVRFIYFPLDTQSDEWALELADEGESTRFGDFTFRLMREGWFGGYSKDDYSLNSSGNGEVYSANIGSEMALTPYVKARVYTRPSYSVEYLDSRGYRDYQTGQKYTSFQNTVGVDMDWLITRDKDLSLSVDRTDTLPQTTNAVGNQESVIQRAQASIEKHFESDWLIGARVGVISRDYTDKTRGSQFQTDSAGFLVGQLTSFSTLSTSLGYSQDKLSNAGDFETDGTSESVVGGVTLRTQLAKKFWHSIGFSRELTGGYQAGADQVDAYRYSIFGSFDRTDVGLSTALRDITPDLTTVNAYRDWVTQMTLTQRLSDLLALHFSAAYDKRMNGQLTSGAPNEDDLTVVDDYDTLTLVVGTSYLWTKRTTISGFVQHVARVSEDPLLEFERETISLSLTWSYSF